MGEEGYLRGSLNTFLDPYNPSRLSYKRWPIDGVHRAKASIFGSSVSDRRVTIPSF